MSLSNQIQHGIETELNLNKWFEMGGKGSGHRGHKGVKGQKGGSAPSKGYGRLSAPGHGRKELLGSENMEIWFAEMTGATAEDIPEDWGVWAEATEQERANLKAQVAQDLSDSTGGAITPQEASDFVQQWAHSSNDDDMRSLAIQKDAAEEFGLKTSKFTQDKIQSNQELLAKRERGWEGQPKGKIWERLTAENYPLMEPDRQKPLLRSMYNETQAELKARGIEEVRLYRGVRLPYTYDREGETARISGNVLESWSVSEMVAKGYAYPERGGVAVVYEAVVPANRILSTPATGFGCLIEGEVIVLEGEGDMARVARLTSGVARRKTE